MQTELGVDEQVLPDHPMKGLLREDRFPHIWCPGCGLGTSLTAFVEGLKQAEVDLDKTAVVSGIGCAGRVAGYLAIDSFHTTHGRAIPFATGLKLGRPELTVTVFSGDGDLTAIGGNHFIHAARRNIDMTVICSNNFIYGMTGGQAAPTTPPSARSSTTPYGCYEHPFSLPHLAAASGASYVARWTSLHIRRLSKAIAEAILKPGFSFVEIISPCPTVYLRRNKLGDGLAMMNYFKEKSVIAHGADPADVGITFGSEIKCGTFVNIDRPAHHTMMHAQLADVYPDEAEEAEEAADELPTAVAPGDGPKDNVIPQV